VLKKYNIKALHYSCIDGPAALFLVCHQAFLPYQVFRGAAAECAYLLQNDMQRYFRISLISRSTRDTPKTLHSPSANEKSPTWRSPTKCGSVSLVMRHECPRHGNWSGEHPFFPWLGYRVLGRTSNPPERHLALRCYFDLRFLTLSPPNTR
jgi:hypothetical protein